MIMQKHACLKTMACVQHLAFLHLNLRLPPPSAIQEPILELLLPELAYVGLTPTLSANLHACEHVLSTVYTKLHSCSETMAWLL